MAEVVSVTLRAADLADVPALRALGEAVVAPTYGPIDAAYAQRMLDEIEALVEGDELWLEVVDGNEAAFAFYEAQGFEVVDRVTGAPWPDDVWMRKVLR